MKRIALLATLVAAIVISDGAFARGGGGGSRGGGLRSSGVAHGGPGWSGFSAGQGRFALAVRAGVSRRALSHGAVRQARIGHSVAGRGHRAVVPGRFAAVSRAVRWHHHPGRGWRRFDAGFDPASGVGFGAVALPGDPGLEGPGDPPLAFGPGGPVLDDGIAAVTTRTGVAYATEDAPGSIRRTHELGHPRPYFPRRRGHN
ncbi:MAG: hypothetical protein ACJ8BE_25275 [Microvirga sp.]